MGFRGRSVVATWPLAAGDTARCFPASRLIALASWAYGTTATAAAASAEAGLVATTSGARGEPATTSRARGVTAELFLAAGLRELVASVPTTTTSGLMATAATVPLEVAVIATASGERGRPR